MKGHPVIAYARPARPAACLHLATMVVASVLSLACLAAEDDAADDATATKPDARTYKLEVSQGQAFAVIRTIGELSQGAYLEVRRGTQFVGYARVTDVTERWPKVGMLIGTGRHGDVLVPVAPAIPRVVLLTDEPKGREAKELAALCGERLKIVPIGDRMLRPRPDDLLVAIIHSLQGGVPFLVGDPIVQPHVSAGGKAVVDLRFFTLLKQIRYDDVYHAGPPEFQILAKSSLTAGFDERDRIPWHGSPKPRKVTKEVTVKRGRKVYKRTLTKTVKQYTTRFLKALPTGAVEPGAWAGVGTALGAGKAIASDVEVTNTAVLEDKSSGHLVVLDLATLDGRAGRDPGCKNKLHFISCLLGTGPRYSRFRPQRPDYASVLNEMETLAQQHRGLLALKSEGTGSGDDVTIHSLTCGEKDKPLVVLAGCFEGTDWITATTLLRLAEVLATNPLKDPKIDGVIMRLQIKIIPVLNVYGYDNEKPLNGKGCEINRNFPYHWAAYADHAHRGKEPISEPESYIIKRLVEDQKAIAFLELDADTYDDGYRIVRARDLSDAQRTLLHTWRAVLNARLRHRFVVNGDSPLEFRLTRDKERPSAINWAGKLGTLAASVKICGDGEDSLINHDAGIEAALHFLHVVALAGEPPGAEGPP